MQRRKGWHAEGQRWQRIEGWHAEGQRWQRRKGNGTQRDRDGRGEKEMARRGAEMAEEKLKI